MTFEEAGKTELHFGAFRGQTIDEIAKTDRGLLYLDWLFGERATEGAAVYIRETKSREMCVTKALETYLSDATIRGEIQRAMEERVRRTMPGPSRE